MLPIGVVTTKCVGVTERGALGTLNTLVWKIQINYACMRSVSQQRVRELQVICT